MQDKASGNGRVTAPNPAEAAAAAGPVMTMQCSVGGSPEGKVIVGFALTQQWMKDTANVLKKLPWEEVFQIMPELLAAQPICTDPPQAEND